MKKNEGECNAITTNAENIKDIGVKNNLKQEFCSIK